MYIYYMYMQKGFDPVLVNLVQNSKRSRVVPFACVLIDIWNLLD